MHEQLIGPERTPWTARCLRAWVREHDCGDEIIVLANREPYSHERDGEGRIAVRHSASGLVNAVEPLIRATSGVWIAHGSGTADRMTVDAMDSVKVPPDAPAYRLRRVWLDDEQLQGYYDGFANQGLWPLCHRVHIRPTFRPDDFTTYWNINSRFVDAVCEEARGGAPVVMVQDYHFALAPLMIRERLPQSTVVAFWHIPWPSWQSFEICPSARHLLEGLLGAAVVGFQTMGDCRNFLETVERCLEAHIDREHFAVTYAGHRTLVRAYPASIEWPNRIAPQVPPVEACKREVREELGLPADIRLAVGVARMDYTKGIEETLAAVERLLECYPEHRDTFAFVQLAEPSRLRVPAYRDLRARVKQAVERINRHFGRGSRPPIFLLDAPHNPRDVYRFLRAADVCYVGSLHDGMNLVAKEFAAARDDERGALVLSSFTGAARELGEALIVNPYDVEDTAQALATALRMSEQEQETRMRRLRATIAEQNAYKWAARIFEDVVRVREPQQIARLAAAV